MSTMRNALATLVLLAVIPSAAALPVGVRGAGAQEANQSGLPEKLRASVDQAVTETLSKTGAPSASIAIVRDGAVAYVHAYGSARLDPATPATTAMRYSIGSISKQFTAAAMLLLMQEGRLSLDDKVARWLPDLTRANDVTLRQLLSMTSGYQDYWPQDYVMPPMLEPTTPDAILDGWAKKPLDFEPGTRWQYSNTNYVAAGLIVEKAGGTPLLDFLQRRIFGPLHMTSAANIDAAPLGASDPAGYRRFALGPLRPAPKEGRGWLYAAGELALTPADLARWDIATIDQTVLARESYRLMQAEVLLANGVSSGYGLGVSVGTREGHRRISHGGEVSGFTAANDIYPDDRVAVVACTNLDASGAPAAIGSRIASVLFGTADPEAEAATREARAVFDGLQQGHIDRARFTSNANAYFTAQAIADFESSLRPLGRPDSFTQQSRFLRGGMVGRTFLIKFGQKTLRLTTFTMPDGKFEQYQIAAVE